MHVNVVNEFVNNSEICNEGPRQEDLYNLRKPRNDVVIKRAGATAGINNCRVGSGEREKERERESNASGVT